MPRHDPGMRTRSYQNRWVGFLADVAKYAGVPRAGGGAAASNYIGTFTEADTYTGIKPPEVISPLIIATIVEQRGRG